ncbi:hypothetical protein RINTHH_7450 [Richelia intracellularis HH01]|uniref:Uncharacterized protein n=1 Tax=Richelia intracellularis HH01 TaxID=1165094 RepID=M1X2I8_9NOST|nr:hypothetical protein RINTHH_7450 [Richelia intracellularis HH01]
MTDISLSIAIPGLLPEPPLMVATALIVSCNFGISIYYVV